LIAACAGKHYPAGFYCLNPQLKPVLFGCGFSPGQTDRHETCCAVPACAAGAKKGSRYDLPFTGST
jgi:hypothetical protein